MTRSATSGPRGPGCAAHPPRIGTPPQPGHSTENDDDVTCNMPSIDDAAFLVREREGEAWAQGVLARLAAHRSPVVFTIADDSGALVLLRMRDLHAAIEAALPPEATLQVGRNYWTGQAQSLSVRAWHALVERHIQDLAARVRELEARQTAPATVHVTLPAPVAVERVQTIERDADRLITRTVTQDVPIRR